REREFKFYGQVAQPGQWSQQGWRLLIEEGNPLLTPLKDSEFLKANGDTYTHVLNWSVRPKSATTHLENAYNGDALPIHLTWPEKNIEWIAMPRFSSTEQKTAA
ncbi:peptidase, partial [Pseudoalteromonas sp. S1731]